MFELLSYESLQIYWWALVSILGAFLVFMFFVQGGQTLFWQLSSNEEEKTLLTNIIGHKWELTFSALVTFGGAFFAAFPLFYSTSFGGAYWVWMFILWAFVIQAVSYEYRLKKGNFLGQKTYEVFLFINGLLVPILVGAAVSTFFTGSSFSVETSRILNLEYNMDGVISRWHSPWHGLEAVWTLKNLAFLQNIALGLSILFLTRINATLYIKKMAISEPIQKKATKALIIDTVLFLVFFLFWLIRLMFLDGFAVNPETKEIFMQPNKYFYNLIQTPATAIILLSGVVSVLIGIFLGIFKKADVAFWFTGAGTALAVIGIFFLAAYNNTSMYPSTYDLQSSLTIANASSSKFTLIAMSYVSLMVPFVAAYIIWAWRVMDKDKVSVEKMEKEEVKY